MSVQTVKATIIEMARFIANTPGQSPLRSELCTRATAAVHYLEELEDKVTPQAWRIERVFERTGRREVVRRVGLSEGRAWMASPESSSRTCTRPDLVASAAHDGPWIDFLVEDK